MDWSLGSFGDLRLDKGGVRSSNGWSCARRFAGACPRAGPRVRPKAPPEGRLWAGPVGRLGGSRRGELRAGRFFASPKVTAAKLVDGWSDRTGAACAGRHVLAIQSLPRAGAEAVALTWRKTPVEGSMLTHPGVYCLRSNQTGWDAARLWQTYTMLTDLEAVFRGLKSELGLRPVFHHKEHRTEGHLFITVLAYQLVQAIRYRLKLLGQHLSLGSSPRAGLDRVARDPVGAPTGHRDLPAARWPHSACAEGHRRRAGFARDLPGARHRCFTGRDAEIRRLRPGWRACSAIRPKSRPQHPAATY
jgi:hypothetical protein